MARLIAAGRSSRAIAAGLCITERTAEDHVGHILTRLGFRSRVQIAARAVEQGLAAGPAAEGRREEPQDSGAAPCAPPGSGKNKGG